MKHIYPYNFQIELVEGCNRLCDFCGLWSIWNNPKERKFNFMSLELADKLSFDLNSWIKKGKRIEFAMHGEPTLNPDLLEIIKLFRKNYPTAQYQLTTNGVLIKQQDIDFIQKVFEAGLNILVIDTYDTTYDEYKRILSPINDKYIIFDFYNNITGIDIYGFNNNKLKAICLLNDLKYNTGKKLQRIILNHAGNSNPKTVSPITSPLNKKCSRVYREMGIHWDGTIPICCIDWRHEFIIGKFPEENLETIWNSEIFELIRKLLFDKKRIIRPCYSCDYKGGFRLGFLEPSKYELSEKSIIEKINVHLDKYEKYMHKNGRINRFHQSNDLKSYVG